MQATPHGGDACESPASVGVAGRRRSQRSPQWCQQMGSEEEKYPGISSLHRQVSLLVPSHQTFNTIKRLETSTRTRVLNRADPQEKGGLWADSTAPGHHSGFLWPQDKAQTPECAPRTPCSQLMSSEFQPQWTVSSFFINLSMPSCPRAFAHAAPGSWAIPFHVA